MARAHAPRSILRIVAIPSLVVGALIAGLIVVSGPAAAASTPVMRSSLVTASDLAGWYRTTGKVNGATEGIDALASYYIDEGADEGVAGDLAFAQSIVETGYFGFSTRVPGSFNNFSGLGAVDGGSSAAQFPNARTGVRAQIQHLRAYADPSVTSAKLANALVDPRFDLVAPKGKAPTWEQFGNGIWATDPTYASKVLSVYQQILSYAGATGTMPSALLPDLIKRYSAPVPRYTSYPTAPHFSPAVGAQMYETWLRALPSGSKLSLYLHFPFCHQLCWYCGCNTKAIRRYEPVETYVAALLKEIARISSLLGAQHRVTHIHWGGGSPNILSPEDIAQVGTALRTAFDIAPDAEYAVEIDPRSLSDEQVAAFAAIGVNRVSLGVQDFEDQVQAAINRIQ